LRWLLGPGLHSLGSSPAPSLVLAFERHRYLLAYLLVSVGVIVAFLLAVFMIGWFIGRRRERRLGRRGEE